MKKPKIIIALLCALSLTACASNPNPVQSESTFSSSAESSSVVTSSTTSSEETPQLKYQKYAKMSAGEIVDSLTLEQKAAQMVQPAVYAVDNNKMLQNDYGSILSK